MQLNSYGLEPWGVAALFAAGYECKVTQNRCGDVCCEGRMWEQTIQNANITYGRT
ncbi:hypothetical protein [Prevotella sp. HMSC073D09]|uniref:hypothetical protein n=1 Tax=Prevotella sp. HMSC073D09 TaxID=1739459 RepID=UPI00143C18FF|nr:hypothetical protein [Prevotella sp. HMSC073D09]